MLFTNQAESLLLPPEALPFALTVPFPPHSLVTAHNPYSKPYPPRDLPPVPVEPDRPEASTVPLRARLRALLAGLRGAL
jgi:hypothetical protein